MYQKVLTGIVMGICTYTDLRWKKIGAKVLWGYLALAVAGILMESTGQLPDHVYGVFPGLVCLVLSLVSKEKFGYGDSFLILICGISLGIAPCIWICLCGFFWAGMWAVFLLAVKHCGQEQEFPFVPFLGLGFLIQCLGG